MTKVLLVLPGLEYSGAAKQAALLALALPRSRHELRVCALGEDGPAAARLRAAGIAVDPLGRCHVFNLTAFWRWRALLGEFQPDVIHTWGPGPLQLAVLARGRRPCRIVASVPFRSGKIPGRLDRRLLRRADVLIARGITEAERFFRMNIGARKVAVVPPGVEEYEDAGRHEELARELHWDTLSAPPAGVMACAGPLEPDKGFRDALWAFDILHFIYEDLRLLLIGTGPERPRLERFREGMGFPGHIHFLGARASVSAILAQSDVVWVPSLSESGTNVALEAMAAGRPVVASCQGGLSEIIRDDENGFLFAPGNKVELARKTRVLLDDPDWRRRMGQAGARRAAERFSAKSMADRLAEIYQGRSAGQDAVRPDARPHPAFEDVATANGGVDHFGRAPDFPFNAARKVPI